MRYKLIVAALLLAVLVASPCLGIADAWRVQLDTIDELLTEGEWREAERRATRLRFEMMDRLADGDQGRGWLAIVTLYRAVARAGQGELDAARWDWDVVMMIVPELAQTDLAKYGETVATAFDHSPPAHDEVAGPGSPGVDPPELRGTMDLRYPRELGDQCKGAVVGLTFVLGADGTKRHPQPFPLFNNRLSDPLFILAALDALWKASYEPATRDGEPIDVYFNRLVRFRIPRFCTPDVAVTSKVSDDGG